MLDSVFIAYAFTLKPTVHLLITMCGSFAA